MKAVADYVHSKGLKFGMYSCAGVMTCAGYPSSYDHEFVDAKTFASWGVDFLKYDFCNFPESGDCRNRYQTMAMALKASGRDILFSACNWGQQDPWKWMRSRGAHMYRSTGDIMDNYVSFTNIFKSQLDNLCMSGSDCFNDMDMLVVGMYGKGLNPETSQGGCTDVEYQTHFSLWAMMNSPLIIGCDIRSMSPKAKEILTNKEVIAINQDPEGRSCYKLGVCGDDDSFFLVRPLADGDYAVGLFNFSEREWKVSVDFWDLGLPAAAGMGFEIRDCYAHKDLGVYTEYFAAPLPPHGSGVYRCKVTNI